MYGLAEVAKHMLSHLPEGASLITATWVEGLGYKIYYRTWESLGR